MAEEDIDNETLQAQIDLSLSFAQNLVSSWVKPSRNSEKSSSRALEAELKEYMRRPPRLGVGAPIPEVASSSRETERLKSHLSGKGNKRTRDEDDAGAKQPSDNEEESRGASIKKKARIDPFEAHGKKKKEVNGLPARPPLPEQKSARKGKAAEKDVPADPPEAAQQPSPMLSPSKKSKKKRHKNRDHLPPVADSESLPEPSKVPSEPAISSAPVPSIPQSTPKSSEGSLILSRRRRCIYIFSPSDRHITYHRSIVAYPSTSEAAS
ncbi:hypothetical protein B0H17DRAFT_1073139 [Mycena rosella]|uniref:Uncharacterized protein n=1 Tax=Mycena rosella TaxID=1033263 RepID=A0AAD7DA15_MYCRO|nr:hypothetical protein B0H17DRAFT_1073139 [Mycena rosella]